jgi:hypothetical protein
MDTKIRFALSGGVLATLSACAATTGPPGIEPSFLIVGGGGLFALGVLFGYWLCKRSKQHDEEEKKDKKDRY